MEDRGMWLPQEWCDEVTPPTKESPDDFIVVVDGGYQLGYATGDWHSTLYNRPIAIGDVVNFANADDYGSVEVTFRWAGGYEAHGEIPDGGCWIPFDPDTACDSFAEFVRNVEYPDHCLRRAVFTEGNVDTTVSLYFAQWSLDHLHRLVLVQGRPHFEQVSVASANN